MHIRQNIGCGGRGNRPAAEPERHRLLQLVTSGDVIFVPEIPPCIGNFQIGKTEDFGYDQRVFQKVIFVEYQ